MKKPVKILILGMISLLVILGGSSLYIYNEFIHNPGSNASEKTVVYEVKTGQSFVEIAKILESQGIVKNAHFFNIFAKLTGERSKVKAGEYEFKSSMLPMAVLNILTSGKSIFRKFTIQEGLSIFEIADLYEAQGFGKREDFLKLVKDPTFIQSLLGAEATHEKIETLEGYLFPETYQITKFTSAKELITNMVQTFLKEYELTTQGLTAPSVPTGTGESGTWSRHKIVTLASIVEKETGASFERGKIASVFFNRLKKGMRLQTDPTIIYGKAEKTGQIEIKITREDLVTPTRYNTYTINGLPPGPISSPGKESLRAVFQPEATKFLYFVSRNDGTQVFSETYEQHNKAVQIFQLDPKAREGKSWRDLRTQEKSTSNSSTH